MKIELIYYRIHTAKQEKIIRKIIYLNNSIKIENLLQLFFIKGMAKWKDDKESGYIIGKYKIEGELINNGKYFWNAPRLTWT
jgi:hypothetical protein